MANRRPKDETRVTAPTAGDAVLLDGATTRSITYENLFLSAPGGGATFDAFAPTSTWGDMIFRNATTNARLPAGASGYHMQTNDAGANPTWVGFVQSGTGAATRTWQAKGRDILSVMDFTGVVGDGSNDDTAGIQAALNTGKPIYFPPPPVTYKITSELAITLSGTCVLGAGRGKTSFTSSSTGKTFNVASGLSYVEFRNFTLTRASGGSTSGRNGIHFTNLTERAYIENVEVTSHYIGIRCGITSFSKIEKTLCYNNFLHGIHATNADGAGGMQWTLLNVLCERNDGYGVLYNSPSGNASVGEIINFSGYANKLGSMAFIGTDASHALNSIRIINGFVGEDGSHGIYLDTFGSSTHRINGIYTEAAGTSACGVNSSTPATLVGSGIRLTANNTAVEVLNCHAIAHSYSGIVTSSARCLISGCGARGNGAAGVGGELSGIALSAGNATVVGCSSKGNFFGIFLQNDNHVVVGNDVTENTSGISGAVTLTNSYLIGNMGSTYEVSTSAPTPTSGSGSLTSATASLKYSKMGKIVNFTATVAITTNGTGATYVSIPLPFTSEARAVCTTGFDETAVIGLVGFIQASTAAVRIYKLDGTYPGANGKSLLVSGQYWVA